jgi:hypothetical protein
MISASRPARAFHCPRKWRNDNYWRAGQATRIHRRRAGKVISRSGAVRRVCGQGHSRRQVDPRFFARIVARYLSNAPAWNSVEGDLEMI